MKPIVGGVGRRVDQEEEAVGDAFCQMRRGGGTARVRRPGGGGVQGGREVAATCETF
jgi:hypothetical protein